MSSDYYTDAEDEGDPSIYIIWAQDVDIHAAMGLPMALAGLQGTNPAESRANLVQWFNNIILANVQHGVDVFDKDPDGLVVPGFYTGLRDSEWHMSWVP